MDSTGFTVTFVDHQGTKELINFTWNGGGNRDKNHVLS